MTGCIGRDTLWRVKDETDFVAVLGDICGKNAAAQTLYFSAHTEKNRGNIDYLRYSFICTGELCL